MSAPNPNASNKDGDQPGHPRDGGEAGGQFQTMPLHRQPKEMTTRKATYICCLITMAVVTILAIVGVVLFFTGHTSIEVSPGSVDYKLMRRTPGHFNAGFFNDTDGIPRNDTQTSLVTLTHQATETAVVIAVDVAETPGSILDQSVSSDIKTIGITTSVPALSESLITDTETLVLSTQAAETVRAGNFSGISAFLNTTITETQAITVDLTETAVESVGALDVSTTKVALTVTVPASNTLTVTEAAVVPTFVVSTSLLKPSLVETSVAILSSSVNDVSASPVPQETTITYTPTVIKTISTVTELSEEGGLTGAPDEITSHSTIESVTTLVGSRTTTVRVTHQDTVTETFIPVPSETEMVDQEPSVCENDTVYITITKEVIPIPAESFTSEVVEASTVRDEGPRMSVTTITTTIFPAAEETLTTADTVSEPETSLSTSTKTLEDIKTDTSVLRTTVTQTIYPDQPPAEDTTMTDVLTVTEIDALTSTIVVTEPINILETTSSRTTVTVYHDAPEVTVASEVEEEEINTLTESIELPETHLTRTTITVYHPEEQVETEPVIVEDQLTETIVDFATETLSSADIEPATTEIEVLEPHTSYRTVIHTRHVTDTLLTTITGGSVEDPTQTSEVVIESDVLEYVTITDIVSELTTVTITAGAGSETTITSALVVPPPVPQDVSSYPHYSFGNASTEIVTATGDIDVDVGVPSATDDEELPSASETIFLVSGSEKRGEPGVISPGSKAFMALILALGGFIILV